MVTLIWTAAVRAIAVITAALAVGVIVVSLQAARAQAGPTPAADTPSRLALGAGLDATAESQGGVATVQPLQPVQASAETAPEPASAGQTLPTTLYPAPGEALPTTRARSISGSARSSPRPQSSLLVDRPLTVVLDVGPSASAGLVEAALLAQQSLQSGGYQVSVSRADPDTTSETAPLRPDAYVSIRAVNTPSEGAGVEVWYCEVEGSLSSRLAALLLKELAAGSLPTVGRGDGEITDPGAFRCGDLLAGRARMPAVLLEVPETATGGDGSRILAQHVANGARRFFQSYRTILLRNEQQQPGLIWPASGPVTSFFGSDHPLGIDIGQSEGPIVAATDGAVLFADGDPCCSYGLYVVVQSAEGITTLYGHLSSLAVAAGQKVRQGQVLGSVGCTGHCYGTHLHFEVIEGGERRNPLLYLP